MDWAAEGLLDGLDDADDAARAARSRLLDELHAAGVSMEELRRAVGEDRLVLVPIERELMGPAVLTGRDVAARAGISVEQVLELQRAIGLPSELEARAYSDEDVEAARRMAAYLQAGFDQRELLGALRVISSSVARAAEAARQVFAEAYLEPDIDEHRLGTRYAEMTRALVPVLTADLEFLLRVHLRELSRRDTLSATEREAGGLSATREVGVAFADLVGFTSLGEEVGEETLSSIADRLEALTRDTLVAPVRLVKTLGDAVMLVSAEPRPMLDTLLALVDAAAADDELPALRAGAAFGPAVGRFGDWYGATVNLASRLCTRARPGAVLIEPRLREAVGDDGLAWSQAGHKRLKGISEPVPAWRVRRAPPEDAR